MSEEIELASKAIGQVAGALVEESQALGPVRARLEAITLGVHYRLLPRVVRQAMRAAELIEASGLPRRAFEEIPDPLLRAILMGGAAEDDAELQELWANLLANSLTEGAAHVRRAFPRIIQELEPVEADIPNRASEVPAPEFPVPSIIMVGDFDEVAVENLSRLELVENYSAAQLGGDPSRRVRVHLVPTALGRAFVEACSPPSDSPRATGS